MRSSIHCLSSSPRRSNAPARPLPARPSAVAAAGGGAISGRYAPLALASPICSVCRLVLCGSVASHQHRLQNAVSHNAHALAMGSSQSRPLPSVPGAKRALPDPTSSGQGSRRQHDADYHVIDGSRGAVNCDGERQPLRRGGAAASGQQNADDDYPVGCFSSSNGSFNNRDSAGQPHVGKRGDAALIDDHESADSSVGGRDSGQGRGNKVSRFFHRAVGSNNSPAGSSPAHRRETRVLKCKATIDKRPTLLDESSSSVFKYRTPHFRATATVEIPAIDEGEQIQVGWIQVCTEMTFVNTYGSEGITSWEFPEIAGSKWKMVSDADGKMYPWYGSRHEVHLVKGPHQAHTTAVYMNDNFFPQVTWHIPNKRYEKTPRLTHVHRKQKFFTFLVCSDNFGKDFKILKTVSWGMKLNISVNPANQLGRRAKLEPPIDQDMPQVFDGAAVRLEPYALNPPNANSCQVLVWRPRNGAAPTIVVPPRQTTVDMTSYLQNVKGPKLANHGN